MLMATGIRFLERYEFTYSLRTLHQKGGLYQKAAKTVQAAWGRAHAKDEFDSVFEGIVRTNHGEDRVPHCIKYDLTKFSRLVTGFRGKATGVPHAGSMTAMRRQ